MVTVSRGQPKAGGGLDGAARDSCSGLRRGADTGPSSQTTPFSRTSTRSPMEATTPRSCVMKRSARRSSARSSARRLEHSRLHGDVERRRDLVADDHVGLSRERARSRRAGARRRRARRENGPRCGRAGARLEEPGGLGRRLPTREIPEDARRPRDRVTNAMTRVERVVGVLEDDLDAATRLTRAPGRPWLERDAVEEHPPPPPAHGARDAAGDRRLAAPRLTDDREALPRCEPEGHVGGGDDRVAAPSVFGTQPLTTSSGASCRGAPASRARCGRAAASAPTQAADVVPSTAVLERRHLVEGAVARPLQAARCERAALRPLAPPTATPGMLSSRCGAGRGRAREVKSPRV